MDDIEKIRAWAKANGIDFEALKRDAEVAMDGGLDIHPLEQAPKTVTPKLPPSKNKQKYIKKIMNEPLDGSVDHWWKRR